MQKKTSKVITGKERRYQEIQLQIRGETGQKQSIARSVIKENVQTYKSGWEEMQPGFKKANGAGLELHQGGSGRI